jgi:hypothetical protein
MEGRLDPALEARDTADRCDARVGREPKLRSYDIGEGDTTGSAKCHRAAFELAHSPVDPAARPPLPDHWDISSLALPSSRHSRLNDKRDVWLVLGSVLECAWAGSAF